MMAGKLRRLGPSWHEGPVRHRRASDGGTLILCPFGHLVDHVASGKWPTSAWSTRPATYRVRCYGTLCEDEVKP